MKEPQMMEITTLVEANSAGARIAAVAIEYSDAVLGEKLRAEDFEVEGYPIAAVCASDAPRGVVARTGRFVQLILDDGNPATRLCQMGADRRLDIKRPVLRVTQKRPVEMASGKQVEPFEKQPAEHMDAGIIDRFLTASFTTKAGQTMRYNLYTPEKIVRGQKYPVVLFIHDLGSCSDDVQAPLLQGTGATVWALESDYGRRPCFVLAPQYTRQCANDDFEVTWEADATVELLEKLCDLYAIDRKRIYATGQSMGCMMICELMLRNPNFFAGSLLVAGQWDPARMVAAKDENLWAVVSSGDEKAFPIMREALYGMRTAGGSLCEAHINARADAAMLDALIRTQNSQNCNLNFTWFEGRSVIPDGLEVHGGMHHICTWKKAYDIKALREWLFEQRLYEGRISIHD